MVQIPFGICFLANAAELKGVNREEIIFKFLLEGMHPVPFGKESLYVGNLAGNCLTSAGTETLVTTFADTACCTFRDRQLACEFFNCRKKSVSPVLVQAQRRFFSNYTLFAADLRLPDFPCC